MTNLLLVTADENYARLITALLSGRAQVESVATLPSKLETPHALVDGVTVDLAQFQGKNFEDCRVVALLGESQLGTSDKLIASGFADCLQRDVRPDQVNRLLGEETTATDVFDYLHMEELSGGDPEFELEIVQTFLESVPELLQTVEQSLEAGDTHSVGRALHTMKGSARSIGANRFATECYQMEQKLAQGEAIDPMILRDRFLEFQSISLRHYEAA